MNFELLGASSSSGNSWNRSNVLRPRRQLPPPLPQIRYALPFTQNNINAAWNVCRLMLCLSGATDDVEGDASEGVHLAVLLCESQVQCLTANLSWSWGHVVCIGLILLQNLAEELCSLVTQCFQLVYTDATMRFLEDKVNEAAAGLSLNSSTAPSGTTPAAQLKLSVQSLLLFMLCLEPSSERPTSRFESSYENKHFGL